MTITIPKDALLADTEGDEKVAPSVGDQVDLPAVVGMVQAEQGDNLVIEVTSVNGAKVGGESYDEESGEAPMDGAGLRAAMAATEESA